MAGPWGARGKAFINLVGFPGADWYSKNVILQVMLSVKYFDGLRQHKFSSD